MEMFCGTKTTNRNAKIFKLIAASLMWKLQSELQWRQEKKCSARRDAPTLAAHPSTSSARRGGAGGGNEALEVGGAPTLRSCWLDILRFDGFGFHFFFLFYGRFSFRCGGAAVLKALNLFRDWRQIAVKPPGRLFFCDFCSPSAKHLSEHRAACQQ